MKTYSKQLTDLMQEVLKLIYEKVRVKDPIIFFPSVNEGIKTAQDLPETFLNETIEIEFLEEGSRGYYYLLGVENTGNGVYVIGVDDALQIQEMELEVLNDNEICLIADFMINHLK